jgi:hypothetical protein
LVFFIHDFFKKNSQEDSLVTIIAPIHADYFFSCITLFQDASLLTQNAKQKMKHTLRDAESYQPRCSFISENAHIIESFYQTKSL